MCCARINHANSLQPIFLRVVHAPWGFINQTTLVAIRGLILTYLTILAPMLLDYKLYKREDGDSPLRIIFQFSTITFILLWLYHLAAFVSSLSLPGGGCLVFWS